MPTGSALPFQSPDSRTVGLASRRAISVPVARRGVPLDGTTDLAANLAEDELAELFGLPDEASWQERALCAQTDPEAFFPEKGGSTREAKKICTGCEVRSECLEYALSKDERFGIWGGLSERERRRLKRRAV
jgi:WhiB family transcriptional regulator, redox-sensing transcriptional regulator